MGAMIHSFTSLDQLEKCGWKYAQIRVYKNFKNTFKDTGQLTGLKIHNLIQDAMKFNERVIDSNYPQLQHMLDELWRIKDYATENSPDPVVMSMESEMGIDRQFQPSEFWDKTGVTMYHGKPDWYIITGNQCALRDLKTGSAKYTTDVQLTEQAVLLKAHYPQIKTFNCGYLFADPKEYYPTFTIREEDIPRYQNRVACRCTDADIMRVKDNFEKKKTGLCDYCVVSDCEHYTGYGT